MTKLNKASSFQIINNNEIDYDFILNKIKDHGYGDIAPQHFSDFESTEDFSDDLDTNSYYELFLKYMEDIRTGKE